MTDTREPIAWMVITDGGWEWEDNHWISPVKQNGDWFLQFPIYLPEQEPPKREWQGLTDEEIEDACWTEVDQRLRSFTRAIEAKLKEKNA